MKMVAPDLVIFDHAPTALLASRGLADPPRRTLIGSGFCSPPDDGGEGPWAVVRPEEAAGIGSQRLRDDDAAVLARCNWVLGKWGVPPLERLGQLYSEVDENFLTTVPELDHFPDRRGAGYWGPVITAAPGGEPPTLPDAPGRVRSCTSGREGRGGGAGRAGGGVGPDRRLRREPAGRGPAEAGVAHDPPLAAPARPPPCGGRVRPGRPRRRARRHDRDAAGGQAGAGNPRRPRAADGRRRRRAARRRRGRPAEATR